MVDRKDIILTPFRELDKMVVETSNVLARKRRHVVEAHPDWDENADVRITVFGKCRQVLDCAWLSLRLWERSMRDRAFWPAFAKTIQDKRPLGEVVEDKSAELDMFVRFGLLQGMFSALESSLRVIIREVLPHACSGGTAEFKSVYDCLFRSLGLDPEHGKLLDLLRCLRNLVHNNGTYFHRSWRDEVIEYRGERYDFVIGAKPEYLRWSDLCDRVRELADTLVAVMDAPDVSSKPRIIDVTVPAGERAAGSGETT